MTKNKSRKSKRTKKSYKNKTGGRRKRLHTIKNKYFSSKKKHSFKLKGGYHQYMSNVPTYTNYSTAGINLPPSESALANPPPIFKLPNPVDNYNHYAK